MRFFLAIAFAAGPLVSAACLRTTEFHCSTNAECGAEGVCAPMGLCSVTDLGCASGMRYSDTAGSLANQCVGGGTPVDASVIDGPTIDSAIDAPTAAGCPSGYNTITGGQGTHKYRLIAATNDWTTQRDFCAATSSSAYLAIPDDAGEAAAIATLAAAAHVWVGITDMATEGVFLTVKGATPPFLVWDTGQPSDGPPPEDCVELVSAITKLNDERCNTQYVAVCECEP